MSDARWHRADQLFDRALDLEPDERAAWLDRECGDDPELRVRVERLLAHAADETPLPGGPEGEGTLAALAEDEPDDEWTGRTVGRFVVERELGRGGMAVVYLARRSGGEFRQQVALKLIKRGFDTDEVVRRFAQERQIVATASHPNVARLIDGGTTDDGRPYFAMEFVEGRPIDRYCDERRLSLRDRLRLFLQVAEAVAYAHGNLVIHRDIKPSNILVTDDGVVKLLDFGIARYLDAEGDGSEPTAAQKRFLTPLWASPEQLAGGAVTTASDVYQLGLLLYLLLTGRWPYRGDAGDYEDMRRMVLEQEPRRPSGTVTQAPGGTLPGAAKPPERVGAERACSPVQLRRELSGDLDNILLKALHKLPDRRYPAAAQLIEDVERYLDGLPVGARPDSLTYRLSKLVGRYRFATGFAALALAMLVAFAVTMAAQAARISEQRDRANREAETARRVSEFLTGLFRVADPAQTRGSAITARELLDQGARRVERELTGEPELRARMMSTIGVVYEQLGMYPEAESMLEEALRIRRELLADDHPDVLASMNQLLSLYYRQGRYDEVDALAGEALARQARALGPEHPETLRALSLLANVRQDRGEYAKAEELYRKVLGARRHALGEDHDETLSAKYNLAALLARRGRLDDAQRLYDEVLDVRRRTLGDDHPLVMIVMNNVANLLQKREQYDEAERLYEETLELRTRVLGPDHPHTLTSRHNLAALYKNRGKLEQAVPLYLETLEAQRRVFGEEHVKTLRTMNNLADVYTNQQRYAEAERLFQEALRLQERVLGRDSLERAISMHNLACVLYETGRDDESLELFRTSQRVLENKLEPGHPWLMATAADYAALLRRIGEHAEAERYEARARNGR